MAKAKVSIAVLILVPAASALQFQIDVAGEPDVSAFDPQSSTEGDLHRFNVSLENPSPVGCEYYIRGRFYRGSEIERRYSNAYRLWPGETVNAELNYLPVNNSGRVQADIDLIYCDKVKNLTEYSFNVTTGGLNRRFDSRTVSVNESSATIRLNVEEAKLVPVKTPPYWKVGSTAVRDNRTTFFYEPTLFQQEEISFAVMKNGTVKGRTTVELVEPEPTWREKLWNKRFEIAVGIATLLLIGNLYLLRRKLLPDEVLEKLEELETDRSIKK